MVNRTLPFVLVSLACLGLALSAWAPVTFAETAAEVEARSLATFRGKVRPLLQRYCIECHGAKEQEGHVRLDTLNPDMARGDGGETWHDALNKLNLGEMPPEDEAQPNAHERELLSLWITTELKRAYDVRRSTGGRVVIRRLTRYEYANTMRDLLGVDLDFAEDLPAEPNSPDGLQNNGSALQMSPQQVEVYIDVARRAVAKAIVIGDRPETIVFNSSNLPEGRKGPLHPPNITTAYIQQYPMEGKFRLRVTASVKPREQADSATLRAVMGVRPSPKNLKTKNIGEVNVTGGASKPQTFEFRGHMENFPLHDPATEYRERRFPGLQIGFWNDTFDQRGAAKVKREKKPKPVRQTDKLGKPDKPDRKRLKEVPAKKIAPQNGPVVTVHSISFEAPIFETWPPAHHTQILFPSELAKTNEREYVRQVLGRFMRRAFRRMVTKAEVESKLVVYDAYRRELPSLELAMREVLPEILVASEFLYLLEPLDGQPKRQPLTDHELASRLSYFLWSTMPDEQLFELASQGKVRNSKVLATQVREMLKHPNSRAFVENFTDQWLNLSGLGRVAVNPDYYPDFDNRLKEDMRDETQHFFAEILDNNLSALNLLDSDFTFLNQRLANHYGIEGPQDNTFVRVALRPDDRRGGLLGQGSILLINSNGDDSHPIYRGVWIRDRLLGDKPASPPPDVPELNQEDPDLTTRSLRKQLELHREKESCNSCHKNIDPWGVALENFDAVGNWRTEVKRAIGEGEPAVFNNGVIKRPRKPPPFKLVPVEAVGTLPNGVVLTGLDGLKTHLLKHEQVRFARALVSRLLAYSLGRSLELVDHETITSLTTEFEKSGYQLDELIVAITQCEQFQTK